MAGRGRRRKRGRRDKANGRETVYGLPVSLRGSRKGARSVMRVLGREKERDTHAHTYTERETDGKTGKGRKGGQKTHSAWATLLLLPVTCTSRVCLPASRSGSHLHSADEAATGLRRAPSAPRGPGETIVDAHVGLHGGLQCLAGTRNLGDSRSRWTAGRGHET